MSEYLNKQAVLEWLKKQRKEMESECEIDREGAYLDVIEEIQSGAFDVTLKGVEEYYSLQYKHGQAQQEIQRLRAALEKARQYVMNGYELGYIDDREGCTKPLLRQIDEALSTTTVQAERVKPFQQRLVELTIEENKRIYKDGINAPKGEGNDA